MPRDADDDAAENIDRQNDEARDRVAAHEFRGAVHRAEEGAFFLEFAPACLSDLFVDEAGRKVGVDRHLLAGDGVERKACADFGDAGRAFGDDEEVNRHQNEEDDDADEEVAAHDKMREAADDVAGRGRPLGAAGENEPCGRDVEREPQDGRDQQNRREGGELERLLDPKAHHQDQHRERDRERQAKVDHRGRNRKKEEAQDKNDADGEADVLAAAARGGRRDRRHGHLDASSSPAAAHAARSESGRRSLREDRRGRAPQQFGPEICSLTSADRFAS